MIGMTVERFTSSHETAIDFAQASVVGSAKHEGLLRERLPGAGLILEPMGRNSAPAVAAACLAHDPDDLLLILPADHDIKDVTAFHRAIAAATDAAIAGSIITFGVKPTYPATGYGYVKAASMTGLCEISPVEQFVEKPAREVAETYLQAGTYFWNAGIFLFQVNTMLEALNTFVPDMVPAVQMAMADTQQNVVLLDKEKFARVESISIDYAVMEHAQNVQIVPVEMGWSDVGGYQALHELLGEGPKDNVVSGPVTVHESQGLYVRSDGPKVAVGGLQDLIIVADKNTIMVTSMGDAKTIKALGAKAQEAGPVLGISPDLIASARDWLWTAFDVWADKSWDNINGGFVEQLNLSGEPDFEADRRVRVQARQVYSFAQAVQMGWPDHERAAKLVEAGIDYIDTRLRSPNGGWVHTIQADATPLSAHQDLYDHAFIILGGIAAYQAIGSETGLRVAKDALTFIDNVLASEEHGGWLEGYPSELPRRANPHMHMLEAMLAYYAATGCPASLERATQVVELFETRFFDPSTDTMAEFFAEDWSLQSSKNEVIYEPGHHYEWATLLSQYEAVTGRDTVSWRRRLIRKADRDGLDPVSGFALNSLKANGEEVNNRRRLWVQLEMFRAHLLHPEIGGLAANEKRFLAIMETYLTAGPVGGWLDETDASCAPVAKAVPASMLYHMVTAFSPLIYAR